MTVQIRPGVTHAELHELIRLERERVGWTVPVIVQPEPGRYIFDAPDAPDQFGCGGLAPYATQWPLYGPPGTYKFEFRKIPQGVGEQEYIRFQADERSVPRYCGFLGDGWHIRGAERFDGNKPESWPTSRVCAIGHAENGVLATPHVRGALIDQVWGGVRFRKTHEQVGGVTIGSRHAFHHANGFDGIKASGGGDQEIKGAKCDATIQSLVLVGHGNVNGGVTYEDVNAANTPLIFEKETRYDETGTPIVPAKPELGSGCEVIRMHLENVAMFAAGDLTGQTKCERLKLRSGFSGGQIGERAGSRWRLPENRSRGYFDRLKIKDWTLGDNYETVGTGTQGVFTGCNIRDTNLGDLSTLLDMLARTDLASRDGQPRHLILNDGNTNHRAWGQYGGQLIRLGYVPANTRRHDRVPTGLALLDAPAQTFPAKPVIPILWDTTTQAALA